MLDARATVCILVGGVAGAAVTWAVLSQQRRGVDAPAVAPPSEDALEKAERRAAAFRDDDGGGMPMEELLEKDEIVKEQLTRNVQFFGADAQAAVSRAFVVVVGLGGVGSHAAHMLLRSGVGRLRLIDFDQVTVSSLNRHCVATRQDVGLSKATCLERHFRDIMPEAQLDARAQMYTAAAEDDLLGPWCQEGRAPQHPDYVIDAIDNIGTKVDLVAACKRRGLRLLCCAGAGSKCDPTRLRFVDISESSLDALGRAVRARLKRSYGIDSGVELLLSTEAARCGLVASEEVQASDSPADFQVVPNFRVRTVPVLGTSPTAFGVAAAARVLTELAGAPFLGEPTPLLQGKQYAGLLEGLYDRECTRVGHADDVHVDVDDVIFLVRSVWKGLSVRRLGVAHGRDKGRWRKTGDLALVRWDRTKPADVCNLVLMTHDEADRHEQDSLERVRLEEPALWAWVERHLRLARLEYYGAAESSEAG
ncbi:unnamed protein product [Pedinophyceae sp. YPF-701]|nr:unnamed protein product [Pedinophyceae sp. YPF-701]